MHEVFDLLNDADI